MWLDVHGAPTPKDFLPKNRLSDEKSRQRTCFFCLLRRNLDVSLRGRDLAKTKPPAPTADELREIVLRYLYDRNQNATSRRGKRTGAAVTISALRADLKQSHGLSGSQIHSNLTYLESQGWVEDKPVTKSFSTKSGGSIPSTTSYYIITAAGIDRMGGPSMFTRDRFEGIKIEATGQNIITLGDGNQVNARFQALGEALSELRHALKESAKIDAAQKMDVVVDVDTLQTQLAKPAPDRELMARLWDSINKVAAVAGLADAAAKVTALFAGLLS
jgi:hypothetical protein